MTHFSDNTSDSNGEITVIAEAGKIVGVADIGLWSTATSLLGELYTFSLEHAVEYRGV